MATWSRPRYLILSAFGFIAVGFLFNIIAFSTPNWLEADDRYKLTNGFVKLGLWEACFNHWTYFNDYNGKIYDGCWWIYSYEYKPIFHWINPSWFLSIQVMMTLTMLSEIILLVLIAMFICKSKDGFWKLMSVGVGAIVCGMVTGICILVFGTMSVVNRQWIQNPDKNYLSFSFGLMVMSGFLVLFGGFCAIFSATQYRFDRKKSQEKPRYGGHMIKPAMPNY
ncbi:uncharacterized protein LOC111114657 [Crassostrea virginica]|uniref:Uncharacterized protein LOC111114657 isoform X1 n=1 Tax=Crassostrea virginica TaxID=6565 RepID=A0A8B8BZF7_CRAVI|nr:uncharacterized protein LOC111114657 isoform X1 [Crassostrea virginica]